MAKGGTDLARLAGAGIGLRHRHVADFLARRQQVDWIEIHSETYLVEGGPRLAQLEAIRQDYPLSCHSVGLSLGSAGGCDRRHIERLLGLYERLEPALVSDHLAWSVNEGVYLNDLLPLPYTEEALDSVVRNIDAVQSAFSRPILVENPSTYLRFDHSTIPEWEFLAELVKRSGCGLLLDVNNIFVSAANHGFDAAAYLSLLPAAAIGEIHLAGHSAIGIGDRTLLIDDHASLVCADVWALFDLAIERLGPRPALIEWDLDLPAIEVLIAQAGTARERLAGGTADPAAAAFPILEGSDLAC
jgi:uncharacterized protein (UPF0276 family)